ncbi:MAG: ABC transporter substrate-binding protein [Myxococcales bacterium]|nr:ABC transporter substrate-binding protein [Myxococcales bacterium]
MFPPGNRSTAWLLFLSLCSLGLTALWAKAHAPETGIETTPPPARPGRIVSTTIQTDELLLALVPADRIVALSMYADAPEISNIVDQARSIPGRHTGAVEPVLTRSPDFVLFDAFSGMRLLPFLGPAEISWGRLPTVNTFEDIRACVRRVGSWVGADRRAADLIAAMDARERELVESHRGTRRPDGTALPNPTVLYFYQGYTAGKGTLLDEMFRKLGIRNAATEAGLTGHAPLSLEEVVRLDPDLVITSDYAADAKVRAADLMDTPLRRIATGLRAGRQGRIFQLPARHLLSNSHHAVEALEDLSEVLETAFDAGEAP